MNKVFAVASVILCACGPIAPETIDTARESVSTCPPLPPNGSCSAIPACPGCNLPETPAQLGAQFGEQTLSPLAQQWLSLSGPQANLTQTVADHTTHLTFISGLRQHDFSRQDGFLMQNLNGSTLLSMSQAHAQANAANNIAVLLTTVVTTDYEPIGTGNSFVGETAFPQGLTAGAAPNGQGTSAVSVLANRTGVDGCFLMSIYGAGDNFLQGAVGNGVNWIQSASSVDVFLGNTYTGVGCYVFQGATNLAGPFSDATPGLTSSTKNTDCGTGFDTVVNFGNGPIPPPVSKCIDLGIRAYNGVCYAVDRMDGSTGVAANWAGDGSTAYTVPGVPAFPNDWTLVETQSGANMTGPVTTLPRIQVECMRKAIQIP